VRKCFDQLRELVIQLIENDYHEQENDEESKLASLGSRFYTDGGFIMDQHVQLHIEKFDVELESYRLLLIKKKELLKANPWLDKQITFWLESSRFLIAELQIWNELGEYTKCAEVIVRAKKSLDRLFRLIEQLKNLE
jgi:hypothetical protein